MCSRVIHIHTHGFRIKPGVPVKSRDHTAQWFLLPVQSMSQHQLHYTPAIAGIKRRSLPSVRPQCKSPGSQVCVQAHHLLSLHWIFVPCPNLMLKTSGFRPTLVFQMPAPGHDLVDKTETKSEAHLLVIYLPYTLHICPSHLLQNCLTLLCPGFPSCFTANNLSSLHPNRHCQNKHP